MNKTNQLRQKHIKELIAIFKSGKELTVSDIQKMYNSNREYARRMIDMITLKIPIYRCGLRKTIRHPAPIYKLLTDDDFEEENHAKTK